MAVFEVLGVERRRRWPDAVKLSILAEVNLNGWSLADVARRHDLTRQHIYQWRREMRAKGLWPSVGTTPKFLLADFTPSSVTTRLLPRSLRLDASNDAGVVDKVVEELVPFGG